MKRIFLYISLTLCFLGCNHKDLLWTEVVDDLDGRVTSLELICSEMNTNIAALQTIVDVLQSNDYITGIVEIKRDGVVIGYTITFGKHDPITIYHGQDGKDGQNGADGKDGQDGSTPVIGVAKDTDGVYYWTLNGEWLLDDNGNKLPVSGTNGKNGTTPQLKIEEGYWYISYDDGTTWTQLGKAVGENGQDGNKGEKGDKGEDGDSMFKSVTQDDNYVYFTLVDGTVIKIAKDTNSNDQPNSEFIFTITYDSNGGEGVMLPDTFYYGQAGKVSNCSYVKEGYFSANWNTKPDGTGAPYSCNCQITIEKNIVLYAQWKKNTGTENGYEWVDLGLSVKWASMNIGASKPEENGLYFAWGEVEPKDYYSWGTYKYCSGSEYTITKYCTDSYWGNVDNKTILDPSDDAATVNWGGDWRMPTEKEINELLTECTLTVGNCLKVTGKNGNSIRLPISGYYQNAYLAQNTSHGMVWSCSSSNNGAYNLVITSSGGWLETISKYHGLPVRPICP